MFARTCSGALCPKRGPVFALTVVFAMSCVLQADARPKRFNNSRDADRFIWMIHILDLTKPYDQQPPGMVTAPGQVRHMLYENDVMSMLGGKRIEYDPDTGYVMPVPAGASVPTGAEFSHGTIAYVAAETTDGVISMLPENERSYIGVRFDRGLGIQYGWIGVVRHGMELEAFAWGYETVAGVPITVPQRLTGDADNDGDVDNADLVIMLADFGATGTDTGADIDGDGDVDITDLGLMLSNYGTQD